jgi:zinc protease
MRAAKAVTTERFLAGYKVPGQGHPDWPALEILSTLLAGGPSSRLYRRLLVETEMVSSIDVQLTPFRQQAVLRVSGTTTRGHQADAVLAEVDVMLAAVAAAPPDDAEVEKARSIVETDFWTGLVDCDGKAEALGHYETALGDFRLLTELAARLAAVTAADVQRVASTYLGRAQRSLVVATPDGSATDDDDDDDDVTADDDALADDGSAS